MRSLVLAALAASAIVLPGAARAQAPATLGGTPSGTDLQAEITRRRFVVHPKPDYGAVATDAERAGDAVVARERREEVVQEGLRGPRRRPDLDQDVQRGIQHRNLQRALRR